MRQFYAILITEDMKIPHFRGPGSYDQCFDAVKSYLMDRPNEINEPPTDQEVEEKRGDMLHETTFGEYDECVEATWHILEVDPME